jgi:hypothetical protein
VVAVELAQMALWVVRVALVLLFFVTLPSTQSQQVQV